MQVTGNADAAAFILTAILSFIPISELRGGIPFALSQGIPWYAAWPFAAAVNALVSPGVWLFLSTLHKLFLRMVWYERIFSRFVERARKKLHRGMEKWGWAGITFFVAVPLPITGAWTGTLGAWVLGLSRRRTFFAVTLGVIIAGGIVTAVVLFGIGAVDFFVKRVRV
ncbi:MAG: small multi-drug export protein [Spirochaetaceae bacterium]|nr:small multi-drug export protein [Spirochaetaceae bacterium]